MKSMKFEVDSLIGKIIDLVNVNHEGEIGDVGAVTFKYFSPQIIEYSNTNRAFQSSLFS